MKTVELKEPVSRFWSKLAMVVDIARILREKPPGKNTINEVLELIAGIIPLDAATLYLIDRNKDRLEKIASHGADVNVHEFVQFGKGDGLSGWVARQKTPLILQGREPHEDTIGNHHDSIMILPLMVLDDLIGVLCCGSRERRAFDANRQKLMEVVADQVAISMERIMYQRKLESKNHQLTKAQMELEEAQTQLINQEKLKAVCQLAATVNHEINNPLSIIIGNAQIIELEASGLPEKVTQQVQAIVDGAKRISLITHKLLKIDRLITESYLDDEDQTMLNIHKSAGEQT